MFYLKKIIYENFDHINVFLVIVNRTYLTGFSYIHEGGSTNLVMLEQCLVKAHHGHVIIGAHHSCWCRRVTRIHHSFNCVYKTKIQINNLNIKNVF